MTILKKKLATFFVPNCGEKLPIIERKNVSANTEGKKTTRQTTATAAAATIIHQENGNGNVNEILVKVAVEMR